MALFRKATVGDPALPKQDRGGGSLDDYRFDLVPKNAKVTIRLENSTPFQDELRDIGSEAEETTTATPARSVADDRIDAPIPVRLFLGRRVSGVVGTVPRGLESVYDETVRRLEGRGDKPRIPVEIVSTRRGWRVDLLIGRTR